MLGLSPRHDSPDGIGAKGEGDVIWVCDLNSKAINLDRVSAPKRLALGLLAPAHASRCCKPRFLAPERQR